MERAFPALLLALLTSVPAGLGGVAAAPWVPDAGDWSHFRRTPDHAGFSPALGAFTSQLVDLRVKWERADDPGYWVPPVAADLDGDGVAEVVATVGNASAQPQNLNSPVALASGLMVFNGTTGALNWRLGPTTGNLAFFSPALGDIDGDGKGDIVFMDGNPLTGTFVTNKIFAYDHQGNAKWSWSDTAWGSKTPLPVNGLAIGDVDGETGHREVVALVLLAAMTTTANSTKVFIDAADPEYRVLALNGEGTPAISWQRSLANGSASTPALGDLDGDGRLDVAWGSGLRPGSVINETSVEIRASAGFADNRVRALSGGASPAELWTFAATGHWPGDLGSAPVIADLDGDGRREVVQVLWPRKYPASAADTAEVLVLNGDGTQKWRTALQAGISASPAQVPPAVADLDGDGKLDVVVQTQNGAAADRYRVIALRHDGAVRWRSETFGRLLSSAPAVGDLTGDGNPEVLVAVAPPSGGQGELVMLNGQTGAVAWRRAVDNVQALGGPLLVDLDGDDDGRPEILVNTGQWGAPGRLIALEPELPDLRVPASGFTLSAAEHFLGVPETASATVRNVGSRDAKDVVVRLYDGGAVFHEQALALLRPGEEVVVQATWTPGTHGPRTLRAVADEDKRMAEAAENDNDARQPVEVKAPDLAVRSEDVAFSDANPGEGDTTTVTATVRNLGGRDAAGVVVRFLDQGAVFAERTLPSVPKGGSASASADLLVMGEFEHTIAVHADPDDAVRESDEGNNRATRLLPVRFSAPDLELLADGLSFSDPAPAPGQAVTLSAVVRNVGDRAMAAGFEVLFLDGGAAIGTAGGPPLGEGASATVSLDWVAPPQPGDRTLTARADPADAVHEQRESNNEASRTLRVRGPDLVVASVRVPDTSPAADVGEGQAEPGDEATIEAVVRNDGDGAAAASEARFEVGGALLADVAVPALGPGEGATVTATWRAALPFGPRPLRVLADGGATNLEHDEANNAREGSVEVVFRAPDLRLAPGDIALGDPNPDDGDVLRVTVRVRNQGSDLKDAHDVVVRLFDAGAPVGEATLDVVPAGGSREAHIDYRIGGVGKRALTVVADPGDALTELREDNNDASRDVVVGKIRVTFTMARDTFGARDPVDGVAHLRFRNTGAPVPNKDLELAAEYVLSLPAVVASGPGGDAARVTAQLLAQAGARTSQLLHACVAGRCVDATVDQSADAARDLLASAGAGGTQAPVEFRYRLFTLPARTGPAGDAPFRVPFAMLAHFAGAQGSAAARACAVGLDAALEAAGQPPCAQHVAIVPTAPAAANVPGPHEAVGAVDWFGFGFRGGQGYLVAG